MLTVHSCRQTIEGNVEAQDIRLKVTMVLETGMVYIDDLNKYA